VGVAVADRGGKSETDEERRHELRSALFGIEASAEGLSRHRALLTDQQLDELAHGLAHEVRRVRMLLEGAVASSTFDLAETIGPVIACARASGLDVRCSVRRGITVVGDRHRTAQVVLALLDNARAHALASPVEVRATELCGTVALYVEDRGRGVSKQARHRLFERGVCGDDSAGSGLGLYVARRIMEDQGGAIAARTRPGGGATFVLHLRRPASTTCRPPRKTRLRCSSWR
jgi:signal transduction histidine kinase